MTDGAVPSEAGAGTVPRLRIGQATSVGRVRARNEDAVLCEPLEAPTVSRRGVFCAVADGMGGHAHGEVASTIAVQVSRDVYYSAAASVDAALRQALETANREVVRAGADARGRDQMGSTITAAAIVGEEVVIGQVGDCRAYLFGDGRIDQLTRDHSWVADEVAAGALTPEQARVHPRRNIITRALGLEPEVRVDIYRASIPPGGGLVLCSDGLHGLVEDKEILEHVTTYAPQAAVDAMVALANERGGPDNISAVVVKLEAAPPTAESPNGASRTTELPTPVRPDALDRPETARRQAGATPRPAAPASADPPPAGRPTSRDQRADGSPGATAADTASGEGAPGAVARPAAPRAGLWRRLLVGLVLVVLLLLGIGLGWYLYQSAATPLGATTPRAPLLHSILNPPAAFAAATSAGDWSAGLGQPSSRKQVATSGSERLDNTWTASDEDQPVDAGMVADDTVANDTVANDTVADHTVADDAETIEQTVPRAARDWPLELEVVDDEVAVRLAPVLGAPAFALLGRGDRIVGEVEVLAEPFDGDPRWYLVRVETVTPPGRGFIHSSLVRQPR